MPTSAPEVYRERLRAPATWWLLAAVMLASLFLAFDVPVGPRLSIPVTLLSGALSVAGLMRLSVVVSVDEAGLRAGRATLPVWAMGRVDPLDRPTARRLRGELADPRAHDLQRPWVGPAVRIDVVDPDDPTPYWVVSTRHPQELARSLALVTGRATDEPGS